MEIDFPPMNNRIYKVKYVYDDDPYWEECRKFHTTKTPRCDSNWKRRRELTPFEVRMYKTWKHNRKTQWKPTNKK